MSSLSQNKQELFGSKKGQAKGTNATHSTATTSMTPQAHTSTARVGLSVAEKQKKVAEAKELSERGMKHLKTSVFQWSPDHLAAAPLFESSAEAYKIIEDYDLASVMMVKSAESHEAYGSLASAALAMLKASQYAKLAKDAVKTVKFLKQAAKYWGIHGDLQRYGETLAAVAKEVQLPLNLQSTMISDGYCTLFQTSWKLAILKDAKNIILKVTGVEICELTIFS